jgi:anthranilate phosphoribosyltransferase
MNIQQALTKIALRQNLTNQEMNVVMRIIMNGEATPAQIGGFLVGLRCKGETVEEIAAAAQVMRDLASGVDLSNLPHVVDIVGTGGDGATTFNVSTASMFVAAAAGCYVAKHGNRSVSSSSGSADVLELAGVNINLASAEVAICVRELGLGFMFAPAHHGAMRYAVVPRRELGIRTIFNVLGPLTNPAKAPHQVLGVFSIELVTQLAEVLQRLGCKHALVVYGKDGVDEISIGAETEVAELKNGVIKNYCVAPEDFGIKRVNKTALQVSSPQESLNIIHSVLANQPGVAKEVVALNAGAAIYVAGLANSIREGYDIANVTISNGAAAAKLVALIHLTQKLVASR